MKRLLILPLLLLTLSLGATKYYVDQDGDNGDDGSIGNPWLTVAYACSQATTSGDTVYINAGTYAETAQIVKALGVHIHGAGVTSIINSTFATNYTGSINCASAVANPVNDGGSISYIRLTGNSYTGRIGIYGAYRNNVTVHHCTIEGFIYGAIRVISNNADVWTAPTVNYATGWSIHDNSINDCGYLNSSYASVWFDGTDGMDVYSNTFIDTSRAAGSNSWATIKCTFNTRYDIHDNIFYRRNHENGRFNFFIESWNYEGECQFRDNNLYGLAFADFGGAHNQVKAGFSYGLKVTGNNFLNTANGNYTNGGNDRIIYAICLEGDGQDQVEVSRNRIQRYGWAIEVATATSIGGVYQDDWEFNDIVIAYNLITDVGYLDNNYPYGIIVLNETNDEPYTTTVDSIRILNNVITAISGTTYRGISVGANGTYTNLVVSNNIVYDFDDYGIAISEHGTDTLAITGLDVTYNNMYSNGTNTVYVETAAGRITITDSDVTTGNITTDPLFKSNETFRLRPTSPCIDEGIDVGLTTDYWGHRVPQNSTPDIGACEYGNYVLFYNGKQLY